MRAYLIAAVVALLSFGAACGGGTEADDDVAGASPTVTEAPDDGENGDGDASSGVSMTEFAYDPSEISVEEGAGISVSNDGTVEHTFTVEELGIDVLLDPGEEEQVMIEGDAGTYELICTIAGHEEAGMVGEVTIE